VVRAIWTAVRAAVTALVEPDEGEADGPPRIARADWIVLAVVAGLVLASLLL
jgi:hypothetical protein